MSRPELLNELVREARREPIPSIDWDRVEGRLFERLEREPIRLASRSHSARRVFAIAAAAAVLAAATSVVCRQRPDLCFATAPAPGAGLVTVDPAHRDVITAAQLREGDRLESGPRSLSVRHEGVAAWELAPSSAVAVEKLGEAVRLSLESGAIRVEVAPGSEPDTFVVRAGDTFVSVHGTVFSVERRGSRVAVHVERGTVAVGGRSRRGSTSAWLMVAPSAGSFSLDGARDAEFSPASEVPPAGPPIALPSGEPASGATAARPAGGDGEAAADAASAPVSGMDKKSGVDGGAVSPAPSSPAVQPAPEASIPEALTAAAARPVLERIAAGVADCHRRSMRPSRGDDSVRVSVQTTVSISVAPEGNVVLGRFEPPLAPQVQQCAGGILLSSRFPAARTSSRWQLPLRF